MSHGWYFTVKINTEGNTQSPLNYWHCFPQEWIRQKWKECNCILCWFPPNNFWVHQPISTKFDRRYKALRLSTSYKAGGDQHLGRGDRPNEYPCRWKSREVHSAWQQPACHQAWATHVTAFCLVTVSEGTWDGDGVTLNSEGILIQYTKLTHIYFQSGKILHVRKHWNTQILGNTKQNCSSEQAVQLKSKHWWSVVDHINLKLALLVKLRFPQIIIGEVRNPEIKTGYRSTV